MNEITDAEAVLTYYSLLDIEEDATAAEGESSYYSVTPSILESSRFRSYG